MRTLLSKLSLLKKLHWLTWCVLLITSALLAIIIVPGELVLLLPLQSRTPWEQECEKLRSATQEMAYAADPRERNHATIVAPVISTQVYQHGWPRPFLARALVSRVDKGGQLTRVASEPLIRFESSFSHWGGSKYHDVSWSNYDNWPLEFDGWLIRPWYLLLDLLIAAAILGIVAGVTQWRMQSNGGLLRFRLADLLGGLTLIGIGLGFYVYHANVQEIEHFGEDYSFVPGFSIQDGNVNLSTHYVGPQWMRKLAGNQYFLPLLNHVDSVSISTSDNWKRIYGELPKFPYLTDLDVRNELPLAAFDYLEACPRLEHLALPIMKRYSVGVTYRGDPLFQIEHLSRLEDLNLRSITLRGDAYFAEEIEEVASLPTLHQITLEGVAASQDQIEEIKRKYPAIEFFVRPDPQIFLYPTPASAVPIR